MCISSGGGQANIGLGTKRVGLGVSIGLRGVGMGIRAGGAGAGGGIGGGNGGGGLGVGAGYKGAGAGVGAGTGRGGTGVGVFAGDTKRGGVGVGLDTSGSPVKAGKNQRGGGRAGAGALAGTTAKQKDSSQGRAGLSGIEAAAGTGNFGVVRSKGKLAPPAPLKPDILSAKERVAAVASAKTRERRRQALTGRQLTILTNQNKLGIPQLNLKTLLGQ